MTGVSADGVSRARLGSRVTPGAAVLGLVVLLLLFAMVVPLRTYLQQRAQLAQLQREELVLTQQNVALGEQVHRLSDPAYLEELARACLGMVKPGEIAFVVVPKGAPAAGAPVTGSPATASC
jgi:cell division protein FtsB